MGGSSTFGAALLAGLVAAVSVGAADDEAVIKYRQKVMEANGANMGAIGDILKFKLPYEKDIAGHARAMSITARMVPAAFERSVSAGKTDAKAEIWTKWDDFKEDAEAFAAASEKLAKVADGGDTTAIVAQVKEVGGTCQHCHESFRKPKEESYLRSR